MNAIWDLFLHIVATIPRPAQACLLGWCVSISVTQAVKFLMPLLWDAGARAKIAQCFAFGVAFGVTVIWSPNLLGVFLGFITGIWAPLAYRLLIFLIEKRFPALRDFLSGDVRGTRENRIGESK